MSILLNYDTALGNGAWKSTVFSPFALREGVCWDSSSRYFRSAAFRHFYFSKTVMSRCFPFPPPGYVRKARADDVDSLKKEKEREKKHRKDRRDKEKRESKEGKEKDRSERKHGDKKEKKEKHRDKKKDRDKEKEKKRVREKDGGHTSEERRHAEQQTDGRNSKEKIVDKGRPPEKILGTFGDIEKEKNRPHAPDARRIGGQSATHSAAPKGIEKNQNIQKNQNNHAVHKPMNAKFVAELGKRVGDGGVAAQSSEKVTVNGQKKDEGMLRLINASSGTLADRKAMGLELRVDDRRLSGQGVTDEREVAGTVSSQNLSISVQMSEGMPRPPKTSVEEKMAGQEKIREKESKHTGSDKHTVLDLHRIKTPGKEKRRDREKRKDERTKKVDNRVHEEEKLRDSAIDSLDAKDASNIVVHVFEEINKIVPSAVNDKKRKNLEPNGFLHENETRQIKLPRPLSALSHPPSVENGRILDSPQSTNHRLSPVRQGQPDMVKADKPKGHKPNGILEKKPDLVTSSLDAASLELLVEKAITRSPHPDLKYLNEVLTVPKFEDLVTPEGDEEWLFGSHLELQKPRGRHSSGEIKGTLPQVWSEAVPLDSLDIVALPYVVPF